MSGEIETFLQRHPEFRRRYEIIAKVGNESERGMTVLVVAELESALERILRAYLTPGKFSDNLFSGGAPPLGAFASKINMARALDLIRQDEYDHLHLIRRIRNEFAHNANTSFQGEKIASWVSEFKDSEISGPSKAVFERIGVSLISELEESVFEDTKNRSVEERESCAWYRRGIKNKPSFDKPF